MFVPLCNIFFLKKLLYYNNFLGEELVPENLSENDLASSVKLRRQCVTVKKTTATRKRKTREPGENSRKGTSVFSRICVLSDELTAFFNKRYLRRSDVVKGMWAYFKANDLMDPKDRRMVILDEKLKTIFTGKRIQVRKFLFFKKYVCLFL